MRGREKNKRRKSNQHHKNKKQDHDTERKATKKDANDKQGDTKLAGVAGVGVELGGEEGPEDAEVVVVVAPGRDGAGGGEDGGALDVVGLEVGDGARCYGRIFGDDDAGVAFAAHVVEVGADEAAGGAEAEGPGLDGGAEEDGAVGHVAQEGLAVEHAVGFLDGGAVHRQIEFQLHREARGEDDEVGRDEPVVVHGDAAGREGADGSRDDVGLAGFQSFEEVAAGGDADALVPDVVLRPEVGRVEVSVRVAELVLDVHAVREFYLARHLRCDRQVLQLFVDVPVPRDPVVHAPRHVPLVSEAGPRPRRRRREDVAGRPLYHRRLLRHCGDVRQQRHRRRARPDHRHALVREIDVLGPELRVHDPAFELLFSREAGPVRFRVGVVALAEDQKAALQFRRGVRQLHGPAVRRGVEGRRRDAVVVADVRSEAVLVHGVSEVAQDVLCGTKIRVVAPRLEIERHRHHVRVAPDPRILEQRPATC
mmetsp:Transcript_21135/g.65224  ORF Transcript_21135/g.65224 Transcript_21135/m.65224 type:complete len:480 (-) Transcript_21135:201-1640(-)